MAIEIDKETRQRAVESVQEYFEQKRGEEWGNLEAGFLLDFFLERIAPSIYNQAVRDAQALMQDKLIDIDGELFEDEPESKR